MALDPHINPQTKVWDDNYFSQQQSKSPQTGTTGVDPQSIIQKSIQQMQQANQPAVSSLQTSIPEVQQKYAQTRSQLQAQAPNLDQQYKDLLTSIKGDQQVAENRQTVTTNNELGRRGITGDSGLAQQELTNAVNPITQQYATLTNQTGLEGIKSKQALQDSIANLVPQETSDERAILNSIAQLQSGANSSGVQLGQNLYSSQLDQQNKDRDYQAQQAQLSIQNALAKLAASQKQYTTVGEGASVYDPATGKIVATAPKTYKDTAASAGDPLGLF